MTRLDALLRFCRLARGIGTFARFVPETVAGALVWWGSQWFQFVLGPQKAKKRLGTPQALLSPVCFNPAPVDRRGQFVECVNHKLRVTPELLDPRPYRISFCYTSGFLSLALNQDSSLTANPRS